MYIKGTSWLVFFFICSYNFFFPFHLLTEWQESEAQLLHILKVSAPFSENFPQRDSGSEHDKQLEVDPKHPWPQKQTLQIYYIFNMISVSLL